MHRLGLDPAELSGALELIRSHEFLDLGGFLSHLAEADDLDSLRTAEQEERFETLVADQLTEEERSRLTLHLANTAGALHHPGTRHSLVRTGLGLFGLDPAGRESELRPVLSVVAEIVQVREVSAGARPGYGGIWTAARDSRLGVVPVGYADGFGRRFSNRAEMLVNGRRVPVVGAVSMDMSLLDLTEVDAGPGDEAVLLGRQGEEEITAFELAEWSGTIPYEVLCLLGLRLPRRYVRDGVEGGVASLFADRTELV